MPTLSEVYSEAGQDFIEFEIGGRKTTAPLHPTILRLSLAFVPTAPIALAEGHWIHVVPMSLPEAKRLSLTLDHVDFKCEMVSFTYASRTSGWRSTRAVPVFVLRDFLKT